MLITGPNTYWRLKLFEELGGWCAQYLRDLVPLINVWWRQLRSQRGHGQKCTKSCQWYNQAAFGCFFFKSNKDPLIGVAGSFLYKLRSPMWTLDAVSHNPLLTQTPFVLTSNIPYRTFSFHCRIPRYYYTTCNLSFLVLNMFDTSLAIILNTK